MSTAKNLDPVALHKKLNGKVQIESKLSLRSRKNLSMAYTPGVGQAVKYIHEHKDSVYEMTTKGNSIAVITDGSAVLGLGNVGPEAALPVMEGKSAIFKEYAGINSFPICLNTQNTDEIVSIIRAVAPSFGGINLEDIGAPRCFEIENRLQDLGIPIVHDDQHATAIITLAALINALKIAGKTFAKAKIVVVGSGAAGTATIKLMLLAGAKNIIAVDSKGIISKSRKDIKGYKEELVKITNPGNIEGTLADAARGADVLIGLSSKGLFTENIIRSLNKNPIIFAMANPDPEVTPKDAKKWGVEIIGTGRSDYPNQVNNALVFPGLFKGLLTSRKTRMTDQIKLNVAHAIASLIENPTPAKFITSIFDRRLVPAIVKAVSNS